jgi:hypothetical protein
MANTWRVAESLETLRKQLNDAFPKRSKVSDGGIGDARHQASSSSDHNPHIKDAKGTGIVTARDFTHDPKTGIDCQWLADTLVKNKDPRIKYIIWNHKICSSKQSPWVWRKYSGSNAHTKHLHLSVDAKLYDKTTEWKLDFPKNTKVSDVAKIVSSEQVSTAAPEPSAIQPLAKEPTESLPSEGQELSSSNSASVEVTGGDVKVETNQPTFVPDNKEINAPAKDGAEAKSQTLTILGIAVPTFLIPIITGIKQLITDGYLDARELFSSVLEFLKGNIKWVFILIGLIIAVMLVKKIVKQVTFWIEMLIKANPNWHNVTVRPAGATLKPDTPSSVEKAP